MMMTPKNRPEDQARRLELKSLDLRLKVLAPEGTGAPPPKAALNRAVVRAPWMAGTVGMRDGSMRPEFSFCSRRIAGCIQLGRTPPPWRGLSWKKARSAVVRYVP